MSTADKLPPLPGASKKKDGVAKGMEITIHVCDETKNLKKDFTCARDLLLQEMKYFQDYLSCDTDKWEDVDISVHCDIKIFDWLITYVKNENDAEQPKLGTNNVVSILISSEFLKMDKLVAKCIVYLQEKLSDVCASPCNMNCINDKLVTRIASTMTQHDLEKVFDKKDKFKSKLFSKKLEQLFQPSYTDDYTLNNASLLFKCLYCKKLLLPNVEDFIECNVERTTLDNRGNLQYKHARDPTWNITEYLLSLKSQNDTWRKIYWRIWSCINFFKCQVCDTTFPLSDLKRCLSHPHDNAENNELYSCCQQPKRIFEPIKSKSGCVHNEHQIDIESNMNTKISNNVMQELMNVKDLICFSKTPDITKQPCYNLVSMMKNKTSANIDIVKDEKQERKRSATQKSLNSRKQNTYNSRKNIRVKTSEDEDSDTEEPGIVRVYIQQKDNSSASKNSNKTWNSELPLRLNQDMQRENDLKRMNDLLENLRLNDKNNENSYKQEISCGTFHYLELKKRKEFNSIQSNSNSNIISRKGRTADR